MADLFLLASGVEFVCSTDFSPSPPTNAQAEKGTGTMAGVISKLQEGRVTLMRRGSRYMANEADTYDKLIRPVIEYLGYDEENITREHQYDGQRPDVLLYYGNAAEREYAAVVLEVKKWGLGLDVPMQVGDRTTTAESQRRRYLREHVAVGANTAGVATNGRHWRVGFKKERIDEAVTIEVFTDEGKVRQTELEKLKKLIGREAKPALRRTPADRKFVGVMHDIATGKSPRKVGETIIATLDEGEQGKLNLEARPGGSRLRAMLEDECEEIELIQGPAILPEEGEQLEFKNPHATLAFMRLKWKSGGIGRADAARCARIAASAENPQDQTMAIASTCFVWQAKDGQIPQARIAVATKDKVSMTNSFDPRMPGSTITKSGNSLIKSMDKHKIFSSELHQALDIRPLQQRFYAEIRAWLRFCRNNSECVDFNLKPAERDQALLRHLIRCIFVWILNSDRPIDGGLFDSDSISRNNIDNFHSNVMQYLFYNRLNTEASQRKKHPKFGKMLDQVPFLNGSLFFKHPHDDAVTLRNENYRNFHDENGLFDILERYHWTVDEQHPLELEQTLDPELLSNLFEQLAADRMLEEEERKNKKVALKAPDGAYYTPSDVALEMAADALRAAVELTAPPATSLGELLDLFRNPRAELNTILADKGGWTNSDRQRMARKLQDLTIFDPCTGSGEFLLAILQCLRTALHHLKGKVDAAFVRHAVTEQLAGQDINPLAAQITKLRLFIAIEAAERNNNTGEGVEPLPNLEARIVCADTLATQATDEYDPLRPERQTSDAKKLRLFEDTQKLRIPIEEKIKEIVELRDRWADAYSTNVKEKLIKEDEQERNELNRLLVKNADGFTAGARRELKMFADLSMLSPSEDSVAELDARILSGRIGEDGGPGFDIVIGNPPYESFKKALLAKDKISRLRNRGYETINVKNVYTLFCEASLALAKKNDGVVCLVVPLSLCFGQQHMTLRDLFEEKCRSIETRSYDTIPDTVFNAHPLFKDWKNRQRVTIVTGIRGQGLAALRTGPIYRWNARDRRPCMATRPHPAKHGQHRAGWAMIPNQGMANLIERACTFGTSVGDFLQTVVSKTRKNNSIALPRTAGYFIAALPEGKVSPRREKPKMVGDDENLYIMMTLLNGHVAYGWWRAFGDAFDVKWSDFEGFHIPKTWLDTERHKAIHFGKSLIKAIPNCITSKGMVQREWLSANFFDGASTLIEEIDKFHLRSLGFTTANELSKILSTLRTMRSPDGWKFP